MAVADRCCERSVSLEDWRGVNPTREELRRVGAGLNIDSSDGYVHVGNVMRVEGRINFSTLYDASDNLLIVETLF